MNDLNNSQVAEICYLDFLSLGLYLPFPVRPQIPLSALPSQVATNGLLAHDIAR